MESFSREFADVLNEAEQLKQDLNIMMENALDISRSLVDDLDAKVNIAPPSDEQITELMLLPNAGDSIRVYELAKQLDIDSQELISLLAKWGYRYNNQMNTLDLDIVANIKRLVLENGPPPVEIFSRKEKTQVTMVPEDNEDNFNLEQIKKAHPYLAVGILAEQGYSIKEIAKLLGRGQGEINLILSLSKKTKVI